jgi:hypothetical protein
VDGIPDEFLRASKKSLPKAQWSSFEAQQRATYDRIARIAIEPHWAKLLDFETRLPSTVEWLITDRR